MFTELHPTRRRSAPASRDTAGQLTEIRRLLALWEITSTTDRPLAVNSHLAKCGGDALCHLFDPADLIARIEWAKRLAGDTREVVLAQLRRAQILGPQRRVSLKPESEDIDKLARDFPHLVSVVNVLRRRIALAERSSPPALRLPPLLLSGPPGTGKTAFAQRLATALQSRVVQIDMANLETPFSIVGLDVGYATGRPGAVWDAMQHRSMTPVFVLDELDKARQGVGERDVTSFLYGLLEPITAKRFIDGAIGLPIDVSRAIWIATCNDDSPIHPAILSRFERVKVDYPTPSQMPAVIRSIHSELVQGADWRDGFDHELDDAVLGALIWIPPRAVWQALEEAYATCAMAGRRSLLRSDIPTASRHASAARPIGFHQFDDNKAHQP